MSQRKIKYVSSLLLIVVWVVFSSIVDPEAPFAQQSRRGSISVGGLERTYHIYIPASYEASRPIPAVFLFHGGGGTEVVLYAIEGGGHTWPGGDQYLPAIIIGRTSGDIDANEAIWSFLKRHGMR